MTKFTGVDAQFAAIGIKFAEVDVQFARMDAKLAELRTEMHARFNELIKWLVGTAIAMSALGITIIALLFNFATSKPLAPSPPSVPAVVAPAPVAAPTSAPVAGQRR